MINESDGLYQTQLRLEEQARDMGAGRFYEDMREKIEGGNESATHYGTALMRQAVAPLIEAIKEFKKKAGSGRAGRRHSSVRLMDTLKEDVLAYLACQVIIDSLTRQMKMNTLASNIGRRVEDEVRYSTFQKEAPGLWVKMGYQLKGEDANRRRRTLFHAYQKHVDTWGGWGRVDRLHLGVKLIELFCAATGFCTIVHDGAGTKDAHYFVMASPELLEWIERSTKNAAQISPAYLPMVIPPAAWEGPVGGGYISLLSRPLRIVKTPNRDYIRDLEKRGGEMQGVYDAVNAIQSVPWQINGRVLAVASRMWEAGHTSAGLPPRDPVIVPDYPFPGVKMAELDEAGQEKVATWRKQAAAAHALNAKLTSRRIQAARALGLAKMFEEYEAIYFPHTMDFRGRIYPVPLILNPQGSDIIKGLLRFSRGKRIGDTTGPGWLAIHGANLFGFDKAPLEDRIDWVEAHQDRIIASAEDPLGYQWWTEAEKPWQFLAFCFEWADYVAKGADHVTHIPIALDGSCSGLQHFSAALRDPVGGKAVNLLPSEGPADVYKEVADVVIRRLNADLATPGTEEAIMAASCLAMGIDRKTTKRATMTLPYGSTRFSCRSFILEWMGEVKERMEAQGVPFPVVGNEFEVAGYLAGHVWESIGEVVVAARSAMEWLRATAQALSRSGSPLIWTTPDGFPVLQDYRDLAMRRVKTKLGSRLVYLSLSEDTDKLDNRRQTNGVAPNWVHSMDATHLRVSVLYAQDNGVQDVAVVHDSFGTHACDTDMLSACLREGMVDLYAGDILGDFADQVRPFLPTNEKFPDMPRMGALDLNRIRESDYVFA